MPGIRAIIGKAKDMMEANSYEDFVFNTVKTCGYNSDTYDLFDKLDSSINTTKYKNLMVNNLKECARESGIADKKQVDGIKFLPTKEALKESLNGIVSDEELDTILFDTNVEMVEDYVSYNKLNGINMLDNVDTYLDTFQSGVDRIDNSLDYQDIKEDIYSDAGLTLSGLENLETDTSLDNDAFVIDEDEESIDLEISK